MLKSTRGILAPEIQVGDTLVFQDGKQRVYRNGTQISGPPETGGSSSGGGSGRSEDGNGGSTGGGGGFRRPYMPRSMD